MARTMKLRGSHAKQGALNEDGSCDFSVHLKYKRACDLEEGCHQPDHDQFCSGDRGAAMRRDIRRGTGQARTQGRAGYPSARRASDKGVVAP